MNSLLACVFLIFFYWCQKITTTKRRQQRQRGGRGHTQRNEDTKETSVVSWEKKKRLMSLFYCTVHSIMWTIGNSKALGTKQQRRRGRTMQVIHPVSCFKLFFSHFFLPMCPNEEEGKTLLFPGSSSQRWWATFGTPPCCSSSVLYAQRRQSSPSCWCTTSIDDYCMTFFFVSSIFETKGPFCPAERAPS